MSIRNRLIAIVVFVLLVVAVFISATIQLKRKVDDINAAWHQQNAIIVDKNRTLFQITHHLGFGGFIHHFKNLVIRQDSKYLPLAEQQLQLSEKAINHYISLASTAEEFESILFIKNTVKEYKTNLQILKTQLPSTHKDYKNFDLLVKVNDDMAIYALNMLSEKIDENNRVATSLIAHKYSDLDQVSRNYFIVIVPLIVLSGLSIAAYAFRVTQRFSELRTIFNVSPDGLIVINTKGQIERANPTAEKMFGYNENEFTQLYIEQLVPQQHRGNHANLRSNFQKAYRSRELGSAHSEVSAVRKGGNEFPVQIVLSTYGSAEHKKTIAVLKDLSSYKNLEVLSTTDHLTQIHNRLKLDAIIDNEISRAKRYQSDVAIILCDIDYFKAVNDELGHQEGDKVLIQFASLLQSRIRNTDSVGRWGGEEFCIVCPNTNLMQAYGLANALKDSISEYDFGIRKSLTASFGVAAYRDGDDIKSVIHRSDQALYASKWLGRNRVSAED